MAGGVMWGTVTTMMLTNVCYVEKQSGGNIMSKHLTQKDWDEIRLKHSKMTKEEADAFIRKITGRPHRDLTGSEYDHVMLILKLTEPYMQTNNQHTWTDYYRIGNTEYHVTTWPGKDSPTIAEYLPE